MTQTIADETLDCFSLQLTSHFAKAFAGRGSRAHGWGSRRRLYEAIMKKLAAAGLVVAGLIVTGWFAACHSFSIQQGNIDSNRVTGLIYYLPRGRIHISGDFKSGGGGGGASTAAKSATEGKAQFGAAKAGEPPEGDASEQKNFVVTISVTVEADPSARYYLKPVRNYFYNDDIKLSINAKHLLSTGNATAEDQTAQIISTAASIAATAFGVPSAGPPPVALARATPTPTPQTINELILRIQEAIKKKKATLDTTLPAAALFELPKALLSQPEGEAFIKVLLNENFVSLGAIIKLLRLYPPERSIDLSKAGEFWRQLTDTLSGEIPRQKYVQPRPFSVVFDPERPPDLSAYGFTVKVTRERQPEIKLLKEIWEGRNMDVAYGIAFRAVKPYRVTLDSVPGTWFYIHDSRLVLLPDTSPEHTLVLDYSRLAFVKKTTNIGFVDGVPQNLAQTAPSSVLGFLAIPKGIIQAIVPLSPGITGPPGGVQAPGISGTTAAPPPAPSSTPGS